MCVHGSSLPSKIYEKLLFLRKKRLVMTMATLIKIVL